MSPIHYGLQDVRLLRRATGCLGAARGHLLGLRRAAIVVTVHCDQHHTEKAWDPPYDGTTWGPCRTIAFVSVNDDSSVASISHGTEPGETRRQNLSAERSSAPAATTQSGGWNRARCLECYRRRHLYHARSRCVPRSVATSDDRALDPWRLAGLRGRDHLCRVGQ